MCFTIVLITMIRKQFEIACLNKEIRMIFHSVMMNESQLFGAENKPTNGFVHVIAV